MEGQQSLRSADFQELGMRRCSDEDGASASHSSVLPHWAQSHVPPWAMQGLTAQAEGSPEKHP